ncbi:hypothetical protein TetV_231 [Tetraselmis virus 1]|uniref:Uncharacterized protein n=1 Tax=Tetraselmis virus 1 TaxID=2060617 RepID=A0A2P0VN64_9VIRU|nr:hypothetical protein QJ968_gp231 [Tetraselmis virus 1]AUF82323.1 hypothetical protein TetV_231 [Tetraselmis virus 1]
MARTKTTARKASEVSNPIFKFRENILSTVQRRSKASANLPDRIIEKFVKDMNPENAKEWRDYLVSERQKSRDMLNNQNTTDDDK